MPKLLIMVPETDSGTSRPVILEIARQIMKATGIDQDTNILYPSQLETEAQLGSRLNDDGEVNKFGSNERVFIEAEEEYVEDRVLTSAVFKPENNFVFLDKALDTHIKPVYSNTEVTINFRYRAKNRIAARRWRDDIKTRMGMSRDVSVHTVAYHYLLPPQLLYILKEIHRLRENSAGYGEDYDTYFKKNVTQRASILTNMAGSKDAWAISETQSRIQGYFDFTIAPDNGDKANDTDSWIVSFSYKFRYEKPIACVMSYPLMIHNQPLSNKYRSSELPYELEQFQRTYSLSGWYLSGFEKHVTREFLSTTTGIGIPAVDDFIPSQILPSTIRVVTALIAINSINPNDRKKLINLTNLGKYKLHDDIIEFLKSESQWLCSPYKSIFNIAAYRKTNIIPHRFITCNGNLEVSSVEDLDIRDYHHVRLGLVTDLSLLDKDALDRLRHRGDLFRALMAAIDPSLIDKGFLPESMSDLNYVTKDQLDKIIIEIGRWSHLGESRRQFNTVESFYVELNRKE